MKPMIDERASNPEMVVATTNGWLWCVDSGQTKFIVYRN